MNNKIIKIGGAVLLVIGTGVATFFALNTIAPKHTPESTATSATNESSKASAEAAAKAAEIEAQKLKIQQQDATVTSLLASISTGLKSYLANNRGAIPKTTTQLAQFTRSYLADVDLTNPTTGTAYQILLNPTEPSHSAISYQPGFTCSKEDPSAAPQAGTTRQYALSTVLPSGVTYCTGS